ncbi:unnamed protein product [Pipistrellus nathusii]|uniref:Uncharacterized protein n=1 Tax=Pipistrellus nathusii TaxID=59473 RepID=A0ABN9ZC83_PIPNA
MTDETFLSFLGFFQDFSSQLKHASHTLSPPFLLPLPSSPGTPVLGPRPHLGVLGRDALGILVVSVLVWVFQTLPFLWPCGLLCLSLRGPCSRVISLSFVALRESIQS